MGWIIHGWYWHYRFATMGSKPIWSRSWIFINITRQFQNSHKDKCPEVPFHRITLPYSYFEEFELLHQFSKKQNNQEKISAEQKWKVCWQTPAMFCLFTHQAKIQIYCTVKLISWLIWATFNVLKTVNHNRVQCACKTIILN